MAETLKTSWAGGEALIPKAQVEAEAHEAYHAGRTVNEACPYPFHTDAALHWLATFNLCIPLPTFKQFTSMKTSYTSRASMRAACSNGSQACAELEFESMQPIQRYPDAITAVKCIGRSAPAAAPPLCISCGGRNHPLPDGSLPCGH